MRNRVVITKLKIRSTLRKAHQCTKYGTSKLQGCGYRKLASD